MFLGETFLAPLGEGSSTLLSKEPKAKYYLTPSNDRLYGFDKKCETDDGDNDADGDDDDDGGG